MVRADASFSAGAGTPTRGPIPESIAAIVRAVPGVEQAIGSVSGYAQLVSHEGKAIANGGAPALGVSYDAASQLSPLRLVQGHGPTSPHDVVLDQGTARKYGFAVGQPVRILLPGGPQTFTVTGIVTFGTADNLAGATIAGFALPTAQHLFGKVGKYDSIDVLAAPGSDKAQLQKAIAAALPHGVQVVTGQTVANESTNAVNSALSFFSTALLVFAAISLFVGGFTIFNTFSIIVGQRTRELALLRILGANRRQIFRSVVVEASIVGALASLAGLGLGVLTALGLEALLKGFGITLPTGSLVFEGRTIVVALVVGIGVTVAAAVSPARRAVRIPPIAAISDHRGTATESSRRRTTVGGVVGILGIVALAIGLGHSIQLVGVGSVLVFIGIGMLAPVVARPMSSALGRPLANWLGVSGRLGRENSMRSPRRTAQTSAALMVGLALVSTIAVFGASVSRSATSAVTNAISADYVVTGSGAGGGGSGQFSAAVPGAARRIPGVTAVSAVYQGQFEFRTSIVSLIAVSTADLDRTVILHVASGEGTAALARGDMLIDTTTASADDLHVGSVVRAAFARTGPTTVRIGGIYQPNALLGSYFVSESFFLGHFESPLPIATLITTSGATAPAGRAAITAALSAYPGLTIQTKAEFEQSQQKQVNQLLGLVYALLALAIVIALIGIVNTLLLSVFERTREIGLLRAVGMRRRQVKAMIRAESVILSVFGAIIGVVVGTGLGVAFAHALRQSGITAIVVPFPTLVLFLVIAALLGLGAASWPARRAAKLDVLAAIATE